MTDRHPARGTVSGTVPFPVPAEVAFDYLVDPRNRPEWQSSLKAVDAVDGEPRVGQRWVDVTRPGLRPAMETTALERPSRWSETGRWGAISASLTLELAATAAGCDVRFGFTITGPGPLRPLGRVLSAASVAAVRADLRRAARILADR